MATDQDPKTQVLRKIDVHRDVLEAEVDLLKYKLRPFSVLGSAAGWIGKSLAFRSPKPPKGTARAGFDLETVIWIGVPLLRYLLGRRRKR